MHSDKWPIHPRFKEIDKLIEKCRQHAEKEQHKEVCDKLEELSKKVKEHFQILMQS